MAKAVAITGGARGIGATTARMFAERGYRVAIGDIDEALVAKTAAEIVERTGTAVIGLALDVTDLDSFATFLDVAESELGGLDVLVNNAGVMPTGGFLDESLEIADRQFAINVRGVLIGSKLAGRRFTDRGHGHLVNIASMAGLAGAPGVATYCATKHAVVGLGSSLHQELAAQGVLVSTICPSFVNTELISGLAPNWLTRRLGFVEPEDVANAIVTAVVKGKGGQRVVPGRAGVIGRLLFPLPEDLRNTIGRLFGMHDVVLGADAAERAAYLRRAEHAEDTTAPSERKVSA